MHRSRAAWPGGTARYAKGQSTVDAATYAHAKKQARAYRLGLWQTKKPTPPWVWRRKH